MSISNQGQSRAHPAQGGPQLNVQAPNIVELTESLFAGNFEKIGHQTAAQPRVVHLRMPSLNRDRMPVASNRRCKRSCNPSSLSSVLQFRAIFNASIRVATPELSIWVT